MKGVELEREIRHNNQFGKTRVTVIMFFAAIAFRRIVESLNKIK